MRKLTKLDCSRGAPMGRGSCNLNNAGPVKMHLQHVPLDNGGYDAGGAYWGLRVQQLREGRNVYTSDTVRYRQTPKLYWYWWSGNRPGGETRPLIISGFIDAFDRADAKRQVLEQYPEATFYR